MGRKIDITVKQTIPAYPNIKVGVRLVFFENDFGRNYINQSHGAIIPADFVEKNPEYFDNVSIKAIKN